MPSQLQVFLLPANFELDGMTSDKHGLAAKYRFRIAGTLESETSVSGKPNVYLL